MHKSQRLEPSYLHKMNIQGSQIFELTQKILCGFCNMIATNPDQCKNCQILICKGCISQNQQDQTCNGCKQKLELEQVPEEFKQNYEDLQQKILQIKEVLLTQHVSKIIWPKFKKLRIINYRVINGDFTKLQLSHIVYKIQLNIFAEEFVERRYKDFFLLNQHLKNHYKGCIIPLLPSKHTFLEAVEQSVNIGKLQHFLNSRRDLLETYLTLVYENHNFLNDIVLENFLIQKQFQIDPHFTQEVELINMMPYSISQAVNYMQVWMQNPVLKYSDITPYNIKFISNYSTQIQKINRILESDQEKLNQIHYQLEQTYGSISIAFNGMSLSDPFLERYIDSTKESRMINEILLQRCGYLCKRIEGIQNATETIMAYYDNVSMLEKQRDQAHQNKDYKTTQAVIDKISLLNALIKQMAEQLEKDSFQLIENIREDFSSIIRQFKLKYIWEQFMTFRSREFLDMKHVIYDFEEKQKNYLMTDQDYCIYIDSKEFELLKEQQNKPQKIQQSQMSEQYDEEHIIKYNTSNNMNEGIIELDNQEVKQKEKEYMQLIQKKKQQQDQILQNQLEISDDEENILIAKTDTYNGIEILNKQQSSPKIKNKISEPAERIDQQDNQSQVSSVNTVTKGQETEEEEDSNSGHNSIIQNQEVEQNQKQVSYQNSQESLETNSDKAEDHDRIVQQQQKQQDSSDSDSDSSLEDRKMLFGGNKINSELNQDRSVSEQSIQARLSVLQNNILQKQEQQQSVQNVEEKSEDNSRYYRNDILEKLNSYKKNSYKYDQNSGELSQNSLQKSMALQHSIQREQLFQRSPSKQSNNNSVMNSISVSKQLENSQKMESENCISQEESEDEKMDEDLIVNSQNQLEKQDLYQNQLDQNNQLDKILNLPPLIPKIQEKQENFDSGNLLQSLGMSKNESNPLGVPDYRKLERKSDSGTYSDINVSRDQSFKINESMERRLKQFGGNQVGQPIQEETFDEHDNVLQVKQSFKLENLLNKQDVSNVMKEELSDSSDIHSDSSIKHQHNLMYNKVQQQQQQQQQQSTEEQKSESSKSQLFQQLEKYSEKNQKLLQEYGIQEKKEETCKPLDSPATYQKQKKEINLLDSQLSIPLNSSNNNLDSDQFFSSNLPQKQHLEEEQKTDQNPKISQFNNLQNSNSQEEDEFYDVKEEFDDFYSQNSFKSGSQEYLEQEFKRKIIQNEVILQQKLQELRFDENSIDMNQNLLIQPQVSTQQLQWDKITLNQSIGTVLNTFFLDSNFIWKFKFRNYQNFQSFILQELVSYENIQMGRISSIPQIYGQIMIPRQTLQQYNSQKVNQSNRQIQVKIPLSQPVLRQDSLNCTINQCYHWVSPQTMLIEETIQSDNILISKVVQKIYTLIKVNGNGQTDIFRTFQIQFNSLLVSSKEAIMQALTNQNINLWVSIKNQLINQCKEMNPEPLGVGNNFSKINYSNISII